MTLRPTFKGDGGQSGLTAAPTIRNAPRVLSRQGALRSLLATIVQYSMLLGSRTTFTSVVPRKRRAHSNNPKVDNSSNRARFTSPGCAAVTHSRTMFTNRPNISLSTSTHPVGDHRSMTAATSTETTCCFTTAATHPHAPLTQHRCRRRRLCFPLHGSPADSFS